MILLGDCNERLKELEENSVDAVVCDPPYGLKFMGKKWDYDVPKKEMWQEVLRVLKPGGHLLSFGGTRTYHRLTSAIEDAGFEIRDQLQWLYGSGFPKSLSIDKSIDAQIRDKWLKISKAIDSLNISDIIDLWLESLKTAKSVANKSEKNISETGMNTPKSGFAPENAMERLAQKNEKLNAVIAELQSLGRLRTSEKTFIAQENVDQNTIASRDHVRSAEQSSKNPNQMFSNTFTVQCDAKELLNEKTNQTTKAAEALAIWLGNKKSSKKENLNAVFAALADDWKLIILNQSKTFRSLDTQSQTDCASATNVTITRSTAECLISFTADILKGESLKKADSAEREVIGLGVKAGNMRGGNLIKSEQKESEQFYQTAPATPEAYRYKGWGTALKPANEPIVLARKPPEKGLTVAENMLKWGVGGLNIDESRVGTDDKLTGSGSACLKFGDQNTRPYQKDFKPLGCNQNPQGRWPANLLLDEESAALLDLQASTQKLGRSGGNKAEKIITDENSETNTFGKNAHIKPGVNSYSDSGGASRFFYVAKASKRERNAGLEGMPDRIVGALDGNVDHEHGNRKIGARPDVPTSKAQNHHPTVKPIKLMEYLCKLVTPPGGTILDPFCGSGSTLVAAFRLGFKGIGIEQNAEYVAIANKRIEHAKDIA